MRVTKKIKQTILSRLEEVYQGSGTALNYSSAFEALIAVILSAQCTDKRVNIVTARLFPICNTPEQVLALGQEKLEDAIKDCGLFRSKAKNIVAASDLICRQYNGSVPQTFDELIKLPGVGRKTANVLLSQLFATPAIAVDTHVFRVSNRLALATGDTPLQVEQGLMQIIERAKWPDAHHWLIWHGRRVCRAQSPLCSTCVVNDLCRWRTLGEKLF
ncbi:MAG: endonuclease III [Sporomusaceae bacterium]|jgi:endonuclease-3|nr:endonuclease III [Sporomusaceae bacterium]